MLSACCIIITIAILSIDGIDDNYYNHGLVLPVIFILFLTFAYNQYMGKRILEHPWLIRLGNASYSIYMLQIPVLVMLHFLIKGYKNYLIAFNIFYY
jgi:peptidoglycan/LPS O-acetylase OafA/YrhL